MSDETKQALDELKNTVGEVTALVQEHVKADDKATIDYDKLSDAIVEKQRAHEAAELAEQTEETPVYKGDLVPADGAQVRDDGIVKSGKFAGHSMTDVEFTGYLLNQYKRMGVAAARPSDEMTKLLSATGAGIGDEYVPTGMAAQLWEDAFLSSRVVSALGTIPMPTDPFVLPVSWGAVTWRKGTAGEASDAQDPATADSTLTATEQIVEVQFEYDLDEDAIIAIMPTLRQELARSGGEQMDAFTINADATAAATGNINLNDAAPATDAYYLSKGQDGLRHYILVDVAAQSANISTTLTDALWRAGLGRLEKYGANPSRLVAITNVKTYLQSILSLTNVRTVDKYGPQATIHTGELAKMDGVAIIASESVPLAGDDGFVVETAASNDEGTIIFPNVDMWSVGFRRQLLIEVERDIQKRVNIMVVSFRIALASRDRTGTHTAGIHGITYS